MDFNPRQQPVSPLPMARRGSDAGHHSDAGSDAGSRNSGDTAEDLFINSTISDDDTHGQNFKIDGMLSRLGTKLRRESKCP